MNSNDLLVTIEDFSQMACLDGHLFNVHTACEKCSNTTVNACLRPHAEAKLLAVQELAERKVGYNFTARYHRETIRWPGYGSRLQLKWPGVSAFDVAPFSEFIANVAVSAYSVRDVQLTEDPSGFCYATVPASMIENPRMAIFREALNGSRVLQIETNGYPKRDGDNWLIALDKTAPAPCNQNLHVQHCRMIALEGPINCEGTVRACYPGTDRIIPLAREPQLLEDGRMLYWFWAWSLVDSAFSEEEVNLDRQDMYKLLQSVDFRCFSEEDRYSLVLNGTFCCNERYSVVHKAVDYTIIDPVNSIVEIGRSDYHLDCGDPTFLTVYYRTDPETAGVTDQLPAMRDAIAHMTAAELPLAVCGCEIDEHTKSYIRTAQTPYSKIILNPFSGEVYTNQQYGDLYGQRVFAARLDKARKHKTLVRI